jgi:hypothetical protein
MRRQTGMAKSEKQRAFSFRHLHTIITSHFGLSYCLPLARVNDPDAFRITIMAGKFVP